MGGARRVLYGSDGVLRAPWRLMLFVALFAALFLAGAVAVGLTGVGVEGTGFLAAQGLVTLAAALVAGWLLLAWVDRRPPGALGFAWTANVPRELAVGLAIGAGSLAAVVGVFAGIGWLAYRPDAGTASALAGALVADLLVLGVAAAAEEALFRGYPFQVIAQAVGPITATLVTSAVFAAAHAANPNVEWIALVNIFLAGVLLAAAYLRTRSLWFATAVHLGWNWAMASVFDLPVSGLVFFDTPVYEPVYAGPDWMTGGAFGPEGGLGATAAFGLALVAVLRWPGLVEAPGMRARRPLVDGDGPRAG